MTPVLQCTRCAGDGVEGVAPDAATVHWEHPLCPKHRATLEALGGGDTDRHIKAEVERVPEQWPKSYQAGNVMNARCAVCGHIILADTEDWPEPLCEEHYEEQCQRQPRVVLTFADGHREMRRNVIVARVYRDVTEVGDEVRICWFEFEREQRDSADKRIMQFYREISAPVDSLGRPVFGPSPMRWFARAWLALKNLVMA